MRLRGCGGLATLRHVRYHRPDGGPRGGGGARVARCPRQAWQPSLDHQQASQLLRASWNADGSTAIAMVTIMAITTTTVTIITTITAGRDTTAPPKDRQRNGRRPTIRRSRGRRLNAISIRSRQPLSTALS